MKCANPKCPKTTPSFVKFLKVNLPGKTITYCSVSCAAAVAGKG